MGIPQTRNAFSAERRRQLLDEYITLEANLREIRELLERTPGSQVQELIERERLSLRRFSGVQDEYAAEVPVLPLARCPFSGELMEHSIDHFGLDGLWWNYEADVRPVEQLPATYFALTGAVRLSSPPPEAPFLCKPGPEVPYVVPRLLQQPAVKAVLSSLLIGENRGYAITYFASPMLYDVPRVNTWGTNDYKFRDETGQLRWDSQPDSPRDMDFDLAPWIAQGKLLWVAQGDATLTLRDTAGGCPYLQLEGRRSITRIQEGQVWW